MSRATIGWTEDVREHGIRVVAEERLDRKGRIYLRWREDGNWRALATEITVRDKSGKLVKAREERARKAAREHAAKLAGGQTVSGKAKRPITITQGHRLVIDEDKGKYPGDTMHRREVIRELDRVVAILGDRPWNSLRPGDIRHVYRARVKVLQAAGHVGRRGAEVTVSRLLAVAEWLRSEGHIDAGACHPPKDWQKELGAEVTDEPPHRPRHTLEEVRAILRVAPSIDPRFGLLMHLSVGLRAGQVRRVTRRHLDLAQRTLRVPGKGKKGGALVALLKEDLALVQAALDGYLAPLEALYAANAIADYPLFPKGQLTGGRTDPRTARCRPDQAELGPVSETAVRKWFDEAEERAGVAHVEGRGLYGIKRRSVDKAKSDKVSRDVLASLGGWSSTEMADRVYADQDALDIAMEAAEARAAIRGNPDLVTPET